MCLSPVVIVNPEFRMNQHKFQYLHLDGDVREQTFISVGTYYPTRVPHTSVLKNFSEDTVDRFVGVAPDGLCVPIYRYMPCGKCLECLAKKQSDYHSRMILEQSMYDCPPLFLTLTYNDRFLPSKGVSKEDVQKFWNRFYIRLRRDFGIRSRVKHILFSEYGSERKRPHYHAIVFGLDLALFPRGYMDFYNLVCKAWSFNSSRKSDTFHSMGFVYIKSVGSNAFRYVSKYVGKDIVESIPDGMNSNFICSSRRFGSIGVTHLENPELLKMLITPEFPRVTIMNKHGETSTFILPKFIRDKIYPNLDKFIPYAIQRKLKNLFLDIKILNRYHRMNLIDPMDFDQHLLYFPDDLKIKFRWVSHLFNDLLVKPYEDDYYNRFNPTCDWSGCCVRITRAINELRNYYIDDLIIIQSIQSRVDYINRLIISYEDYIKRNPLASSGARGVYLHSEFVKEYKNRILDSQ